MTEMQRLLQEHEANKVNKNSKFFKVNGGQDYYIRFIPDGDKSNKLFFVEFISYALDPKTFINYPSRMNIYQETLNKLWNSGKESLQTLYSLKKGHETRSVNILVCDKEGMPIDSNPLIWQISSKKLWEDILSNFNKVDFIDDDTTVYFKIVRKGEKAQTTYDVTLLHGEDLDYDNYEGSNLSASLNYSSSDMKAKSFIAKLEEEL